MLSKSLAGSSRRLLLLAAALATGACHPQREAEPKALTAVKVRAVESSSAAAAARYAADITPASRVDLAFKVGGYVDMVARAKGVDGKARLLQEGDRVTRGMELASIRKQEYSHKLSEAEAGLEEATAAQEQAELDYQRAQKLVAGNSISEAQLDSARVRLHAASARSDGARVRVEEARTMLADTSIRAPMDGVIARRSIEIGTLAAPGTVALSIADTDTMKVVFGVPDTVRGLLELGAVQTITSEAYPGSRWQGRVSRIASIADPRTRLFDVELTIDNASQKLKAGMVAALQLRAEKAAGSVAVLPLSAIVRSPKKSDGFAVYALDDSREPPLVQLRDVELGQFLGNVIPVQAGLRAGEKVVVQGASLLSDREAVRVIP